MTKSVISLFLALSLCLVSFAAASAQSGDVLWTSNEKPNKIVVVSDLHLGVDDAYSETVANRTALVEFLQKLQNTPDVTELVIAGDFLDEWYLPMDYPTYSDSSEFYRRVIQNNQGVIDQLNSLIQSGLRVVYVPGNHDLLLASGILDEALPGVVQARDAEGLGVYRCGSKQQIAIEHGHRYDVFSAPDAFSNKELCGNDNTLLPPGYFYARYAASWVTQGRPSVAKDYPVIETVPGKDDTDQLNAYLYYRILAAEFTRMTPKEGFADKSFDLQIAGFNGAYSIADLYPVLQADGTISAPVLYQNFQRTWEQREKANLVKVEIPFSESVSGTLGHEFYANQAKAQYLENNQEAVDLVVFGHTHIPHYLALDSGKLYVNSGTWVDHNTSCEGGMTRTFVVIEENDKLTASLCQYKDDGTVSDVTQSVIR